MSRKSLNRFVDAHFSVLLGERGFARTTPDDATAMAPLPAQVWQSKEIRLQFVPEPDSEDSVTVSVGPNHAHNEWHILDQVMNFLEGHVQCTAYSPEALVELLSRRYLGVAELFSAPNSPRYLELLDWESRMAKESFDQAIAAHGRQTRQLRKHPWWKLF